MHISMLNLDMFMNRSIERHVRVYMIIRTALLMKHSVMYSYDLLDESSRNFRIFLEIIKFIKAGIKLIIKFCFRFPIAIL